MRLRTFSAHDMPSAMKMVRDALGDHAIIIASEPQGKNGIVVTAAIEEEDEEDFALPPSPPVAAAKPRDNRQAEALDRLRFEVQNILRFHNVPELFVAKIMQKATDEALTAIVALSGMSAGRERRHLIQLTLEKLLGAYYLFDPLPLEGRDMRVMLVGPPGIGKTLTVAKMAAKLTMNKQPLTVMTTDNKRAGGIEQLQAFTNILGLDLKVASSRMELWRQVQQLPASMRVLVDTAGCNPYDAKDIEELKGCAMIESIEPVLVLPAGGDSLEAIDMVEAFMALPLRRLMVTRADTARRFGGVLATAAAHGLAFSNVSSSSSIIDPLQAMDGALLAQLLLRYQLQTT